MPNKFETFMDTLRKYKPIHMSALFKDNDEIKTIIFTEKDITSIVNDFDNDTMNNEKREVCLRFRFYEIQDINFDAEEIFTFEPDASDDTNSIIEVINTMNKYFHRDSVAKFMQYLYMIYKTKPKDTSYYNKTIFVDSTPIHYWFTNNPYDDLNQVTITYNISLNGEVHNEH